MNKKNIISTKKTRIYYDMGAKIVVETENLTATRKQHYVAVKNGKNTTTTGFWHGGHAKPYGGVPRVTPMVTPEYFINSKQFFMNEKMLKFYIDKNIVPPFVGDDFDISFKNWARFKHLYNETKSVISNNNLVNRLSLIHI